MPSPGAVCLRVLVCLWVSEKWTLSGRSLSAALSGSMSLGNEWSAEQSGNSSPPPPLNGSSKGSQAVKCVSQCPIERETLQNAWGLCCCCCCCFNCNCLQLFYCLSEQWSASVSGNGNDHCTHQCQCTAPTNTANQHCNWWWGIYGTVQSSGTVCRSD